MWSGVVLVHIQYMHPLGAQLLARLMGVSGMKLISYLYFTRANVALIKIRQVRPDRNRLVASRHVKEEKCEDIPSRSCRRRCCYQVNELATNAACMPREKRIESGK